MKWLGLFASAALVLTAVVASGAASSPGTRAQRGDECVSARVHYEPGPRRDLRSIPWVFAGRWGREITGYLFYYRVRNDDPRLRDNPRLVIYAGGRMPGGNASTKIYWSPRLRHTSTLRITGQRLDGPGTFRQDERVAGGGGFPSIIEVPEAGCWRLTLRNGPQVVRLAVLAISP